MTIDVYNKEHSKVGTLELPPKVFDASWNPRLVHQVIVSLMSSARKPLAHTKGRSEVRGGGKKPWRQKHTGRARVGSSRSPLWRHGGVTFGPTNERVFFKKVNKDMKRKALYSVLSKKLADDEIRVIDTFGFKERKTKEAAHLFGQFKFGSAPSVICIPAEHVGDASRTVRNIPRADVVGALSLGVYDCLTHKYVFFEQDALAQLSKRHTT